MISQLLDLRSKEFFISVKNCR